jgi:nucleoside-diphosphate-sugar epimerase
MKILITGGSGFIGSNIVKKLSSEKHIVYCLPKNIENIKLEVSMFSPDVVVHCGWSGGNSYQSINNSNQFTENLNTSIQLVESLKDVNKKTKFIGFGSFTEYGDKNFIVDESIQESPIDLYGLSKYAFKRYSELVCKQNNIDWVWIRPCYVYGPGDVSTRLIPTVINKFLNNEEVLLDECNKTIDYMYIDDFVDMFSKLLVSQSTGIYNICSGYQYNLKEVINKISTLCNSKSRLSFNPELNRNSPLYICGDNAKIRTITNIESNVDLESGILKTINYYKK